MALFNDDYVNRTKVFENHPTYTFIKSDIEYFSEFVWQLSDLISWNGHIITFPIHDKLFLMQNEILDSVVNTINSIKYLLKFGHLSDVNVLIRKIRDDLFLFLYLIEVCNRSTLGNTTTHELNAKNWMENKLSDLKIKKILYFLQENEVLKSVINKYNLRSKWEAIGKNLNNFVHGNGIIYYQLNFSFFDQNTIDKVLKDLGYKLNYIISVFIVLLILVKPMLIMSSDYVDALEVGLDPEPDSQYKVAPFVQKFIDEHIIKLHPELKSFLKNNVYMHIE